MPKRSTNTGFTLVELLVVVSIIAILSVVGVTVFGNVQKNARDARRKADIDAIAKALEAHYTSEGSRCPGITGTLNAGYYCPLKNEIFASGGVPADPGSYVYCLKGTYATAITNPNPGEISSSCPSGWYKADPESLGDGFGGRQTFADTWAVCARTENLDGVYCLHSQQ